MIEIKFKKKVHDKICLNGQLLVVLIGVGGIVSQLLVFNLVTKPPNWNNVTGFYYFVFKLKKNLE
jgi:hypothetical protein